MREILFRGKQLDTSEWVEGFYAYADTPNQSAHIIIEKTCSPNCKPLWGHRIFEVDPATVGQYIGQTDKNGKRIFEGDILRITDRYGKYLDWRVEFRKGAFHIKHPDCNYWCGIGDVDGYIIEIIGNIHDKEA